MRVPNESVRWLLIEYYNLDTGFFYHAYEESDLKGNNEEARLREMYEHYFKNDKDSEGENLLLIDVKNIKAYLLSKQIRYVKKAIK